MTIVKVRMFGHGGKQSKESQFVVVAGFRSDCLGFGYPTPQNLGTMTLRAYHPARIASMSPRP